MANVFICYRRSDSAGLTGRLYDHLVAHYGEDRVFWDVDSIPYGVDFREHVHQYLKRCTAVLVVIGSDWAGTLAGGSQRITAPDDYVRVEIETALSLNLFIIPILVGRTTMPQCDDLPTSVAPIVYRNAASLDPGRSFHSDVKKLIAAIDHVAVLPSSDDGPATSNDGYATTAISRTNPGLLVFLLDQSGSMAEPIDAASPTPRSRAEIIASMVNRMLLDVVLRCTKDDAVRDYFHVSVIGYGNTLGSAFGGSLAGKEVVRLSDLDESPMLMEARTRKTQEGVEIAYKVPLWITSVANGSAPMCAALRKTHHVVRKWIDEGRTKSYPPIVFHITDGAASDGDPRIPAANLARLKTDVGRVLLFNCCLSYVGGAPVLYPDNDSMIADEYGKILFEMSSVLPSTMVRNLQQSGGKVSSGSRGFVFQAEMSDVISFLQIGTRPAQLL